VDSESENPDRKRGRGEGRRSSERRMRHRETQEETANSVINQNSAQSIENEGLLETFENGMYCAPVCRNSIQLIDYQGPSYEVHLSTSVSRYMRCTLMSKRG